MTLVTSMYLGGGAYVSLDMSNGQFAFAANDHRNVSVWVDREGMVMMARMFAQWYPDLAKEMVAAMVDQGLAL